ncbi:MAG TPA: SH3 domain-containing protein [Candidatus Mediterraneibacter norfolkensis]|nr:SH3 domain-containing protein [Candidatus Mediterraneibacter norfolkensis]
MDKRERRSVKRRGRISAAHRKNSGRDVWNPGISPMGMNGPQNRRKNNRGRRQRRKMVLFVVILAVIIIAAAIGVFLIWQRYGPSDERADLEQYYGLESEDGLAVVIDDQVINNEGETAEGQGSEAPGRMYDGQYYIEYSVVRDWINKRFYWDPNENVLLYTLPDGNVTVVPESSEYTDINESKSADYVILKTEGQTAYIALPFIQTYTNMEYSVYDDPKRVVITSQWGEIQTAEIRKDTEVRYRGGVKSPILTEVSESDKVTVLEDENDWMRVSTEDGFIGYVKTSALADIRTETTSREFEEPVYTNISKDYTINMAWHNVSIADANGYIENMIADTEGLTTIAPTWFSIADTNGNMTSIASSDYVTFAHQAGLEVWAVLRDFHGGINSYDETYEVLSYTSKRTRLIDQVITAALQTGVDGINLDFELVSTQCGEHYIQFVRELSVECRRNGLVFSVDNYVPQAYNEHYDLEEQGVVADYVMIMCYDEHTDSSYEAGSVSSISYVENGITEALRKVPASKLAAGIPFYTRLWTETPKTEEELAEEAGTEAASYPNKISSEAMGMEEAQEAVRNAGVQTQWDDNTKQNYAEWETAEGTCRIWLEDEQSLEEKLAVISENGLAGVAEWSLGWEEPEVWELIGQYIN